MGVRVSAPSAPMADLTLGWQVLYVFGEGVLIPEVNVDPAPANDGSTIET